MTGNKLESRVQIPSSSQLDDKTQLSMSDEPEVPNDTENPPFDKQKLFITLFVIFLTIGSFVYLVFIDETKPSSPVTESVTATNESGSPLFTKREVSAPIEDTSESLMESLPVEKNEPLVSDQ